MNKWLKAVLLVIAVLLLLGSTGLHRYTHSWKDDPFASNALKKCGHPSEFGVPGPQDPAQLAIWDPAPMCRPKPLGYTLTGAMTATAVGLSALVIIKSGKKHAEAFQSKR